MNIRKEDEEFIKELKELYKKHMKVINTDDYIFVQDVETEDETEDEINRYIDIIGE